MAKENVFVWKCETNDGHIKYVTDTAKNMAQSIANIRQRGFSNAEIVK